jgi:putative endonuclease
MPYFVYLLECKDKSIYTGITTDVERRFKEHKNRTGAHYTRAHDPQKIVYTETHHTRSQALKREAEIKRWKREKKLALISQPSSLDLRSKKATGVKLVA